MLHYVIFALAAVSTCSGENPSLPTLRNELTYLSDLMNSIETRIQTVAKTEVGALTNASITCWALHLAGFKADVQDSYSRYLEELRKEIQSKLDKSSSMSQAELDELEGELVDGTGSSLTARLSSNVEKFIQDASETIKQLNLAKQFKCTPSN